MHLFDNISNKMVNKIKNALLKLDEIHLLLICADGVNLLYENTNSIKRNTVALLDTSNKVYLESKCRENLSTYLCFVIRMQDEIVNYRQVINASNRWQNANIGLWE